MKTSSDKFFDMLNEEFKTEQDLTDSQILEKRMEEGFKQIDQKISEAIENMQQLKDTPEEIPEDPKHENQETEDLENNEGDEENE